MKISDIFIENNSLSTSKISFVISNIALIFGFVWGVIHPNPYLPDLMLTFGGVVHGSRNFNKFVAFKYGQKTQ